MTDPDLDEKKSPIFEKLERGKVLVEECRALKKEIEEKLSKVQGRTGLSLKELKEFFENKANFSEEKWNSFQKKKAAFESNFKKIGGLKSLMKKAENKDKGKSNKKAKKLGNRARQRPNWLSM